MGIQRGPIFLERTIAMLVFYKRLGHYYVRLKPRMPDVRKDKRFRNTMRSAGRMARASKIGSALYAVLPGGLKQFKRYRTLTGEAYLLLKAGKTDEQAMEFLWPRLKDLIERSCAIAMTVYDGLGTGFRREWMLWAFAGEAMEMIKEGKGDQEVLTTLWNIYAREFESGYREEKTFVHLPVSKRTAVLKKKAGIPKLALSLPVEKVRGRWYVPGSSTTEILLYANSPRPEIIRSPTTVPHAGASLLHRGKAPAIVGLIKRRADAIHDVPGYASIGIEAGIEDGYTYAGNMCCS